jgi:hypothetical protein
MKLLVGSLLVTAAVANLGHINNASIEFSPNLNCGSCIRGGYNYCDYYSYNGDKIDKNSTSGCFSDLREVETTITKPGVWNETGYFCSRWFENKLNAIINQCNADVKQEPACGAYFN